MLPARSVVLRLAVFSVLALTIAAAVGIGLLIESKYRIFTQSLEIQEPADVPEPFPVSVDAYTQIIHEDPTVEAFYTQSLAAAPRSKEHWWNQVAAVFSSRSWYQNLASPVSRIIVIWPGERKEQIIDNISAVLRWTPEDREEFLRLTDQAPPDMPEGKYFPGQYVIHRHATPAEVHQLIYGSFESEVLARYTPAVNKQVPLQDALIIASLIEREASDFENMRAVSGVIWNRIFDEMPLQLDATLQYVRASNPQEVNWWPAVQSRDKFLSSPFNTYENTGLPPSPIANPSTEAIVAALNPIQTDCLYYFHTKNADYHCSATYEEHVEKLKGIYGRGS